MPLALGSSFTKASAGASSVKRMYRGTVSAWNADAADWVSRVYAAGATVSSSTANAVTAFCNAIDSAGLRSLLWRVNPMCGSGLGAVCTPLYRGPSSSVVGNAADTNENFVSGDYAETSGLLGNGSTKRLLTGLAVNFDTSRHLACFVHTAASAFRVYVGATGDTTFAGRLTLETESPSPNFRLSNCSAASASGGVTGGMMVAPAFILGTSNGTNAAALYANGTATGTSGSSFTSGSVSTQISVFARSNANASFSEHANARLGGYSIGTHLSAAQALAYSTIWDSLFVALGRK